MRWLWVPTALLQLLDIYTTSRVSMEREANLFMASLWGISGFWLVALVKILAVSGLGVFHILLVKYLPDLERPFMVGMIPALLTMVALVVWNIQMVF